MADGRLQPGDRAPDFELDSVDGGKVALADYRGQRVIVYFYPKAATSGCTVEACDFRDRAPDLAVPVLGISRDPLDALAAFRDEHGLSFPLLSDPDHAVHEAYGAWGDKVVDGETVQGVIRSTFVVGPDGTVESAQYGVSVDGHVAGLVAALGS